MIKKNILFIPILIVFVFMLIPSVKADTTVDLSYQEFIPVSTYEPYYKLMSSTDKYLYSDFESFISDYDNKQIFDDVYTSLIDYYNVNYKSDYPYYYVSVAIISSSSDKFNLSSIRLTLHYKDNLSKRSYYVLSAGYIDGAYYTPDSTSLYGVPTNFIDLYSDLKTGNWLYAPTGLFESNFDMFFVDEDYTFNIYDSNSNLLNTYTYGDIYPVMYSDGYDSFISSRYTTVDLDKYNYVILNLKDYSKTEAFSSNLQVKGMIGITPIYNYGTTEKDSVTDRCNLSYSDFTDYRLYILDSDLTNKAVYAVKACEDNSSFKFDNTIFDITYVTDENIDDPVITIDGIDYHTIPFADLSVTANSNEDNNYIPGESSNIASGDKSSLKSILENVTDTLSDIWDTIIYFFSFVTKVFSILPTEIKAISLTTFITGCILGLIKILKS
jgi:hypothetical protein